MQFGRHRERDHARRYQSGYSLPGPRPDHGCERCSAEAEIPVAWVLDEVTGRSGAETDYVLPEPLKCPRCFQLIDEETLVEWE